MGITNFLIDHPLPSYPPCLINIAEYQGAIKYRIHIYHTNQFNTILYSIVKHENIIDSCQDDLILASDFVIDTYEWIDSQIFGFVVQSVAIPKNRNFVHVILDDVDVSYKLLTIYFISFLYFINIISISCLF